MISFCKHNNIDFKKWDDCILNSINRKIYSFSWYLDIVANKSWDALILDDYKAVMPLPYRRKLGKEYIYMPYFTQSLGVFFRDKNDIVGFKNFLNYIPKKIKFIDYNYFENLEIINNCKILFEKRKNQFLSMKSNYNEIYASFSNSHKKNIRRAASHELLFEEFSCSGADFVSFFKSNLGGKLNFAKKDYDCLNKIITFSINNKKGSLYVVKKLDVILNMAFLLFDNNRIYLLASASSKDGKSKKSSFFLLNELIKKYSSDYDILDFCGSNIQGIYDYNNGFGAQEVIYNNCKMSRLKFPFSLLKSI